MLGDPVGDARGDPDGDDAGDTTPRRRLQRQLLRRCGVDEGKEPRSESPLGGLMIGESIGTGLWADWPTITVKDVT